MEARSQECAGAGLAWAEWPERVRVAMEHAVTEARKERASLRAAPRAEAVRREQAEVLWSEGERATRRQWGCAVAHSRTSVGLGHRDDVEPVME